MNFYYDPILGLQYNYLGVIIVMDIDYISKDLNIQQLLEEWERYYNFYWDSGVNFYPNIEIIGNITNYRL